MIERPIIFSTAMVEAIMAGKKTVTRRVARLTPDWEVDASRGWGRVRPGDRLWVRETWRVASSGRHYPTQKTRIYAEWRARVRGTYLGQEQDEWACSDAESDALLARAYGRSRPGQWRPSIHMPRWASRLNLVVEDVRAERLLDISHDDIAAEGCSDHEDARVRMIEWQSLWDSLHGRGASAINPWVWRVQFRAFQNNTETA